MGERMSWTKFVKEDPSTWPKFCDKDGGQVSGFCIVATQDEWSRKEPERSVVYAEWLVPSGIFVEAGESAWDNGPEIFAESLWWTPCTRQAARGGCHRTLPLAVAHEVWKQLDK